MQKFPVILFLLAATPAPASTVPPGDMSLSADTLPVTLDTYSEIINARRHSYRDQPGPAPLFVAGMALHLFWLAAYAIAISAVLPGPRKTSRRQAAIAAAAMSRTR